MQEKQNIRRDHISVSVRARLALCIAATLAFTVGIGASARASIIVNGDFEGGTTGGVPNGWSFDDNGDTNATVAVDSGTVGESAFTSGSQSARLSNDTDNDGSAGSQSFNQSFDPVSGQLQYVFDFYLDDSTPNDTHWNAQLRGDGNTNQAFAYNIDHHGYTEPAGQFTLIARGGNDAQEIVLDAQAWYRVTTNLDTDTQTFSGTLENTGGLVTTITSKTFQQTVNAFDLARFTDGGAGDDGSPINIDNVSLIPEPSSLLLLGLGAVTMLNWRKRRRL